MSRWYRGFLASSVICLGIVVAALPNLPWPMHGDQVLFLQGAESVARGELLYRDFWDLKQPGIIIFYYFGGRSCSFDEWGIHQFELFFWLGAGIFLSWAWPHLAGRAGVSLWPCLTIPVWYYAVTGSMQHTQVETLIGPVLFLHWWLWHKATHPRWGYCACVAAGSIAAIVLLFKFMFVPLLGLAWLQQAITHGRNVGWRVVGGRTVLALGGGVVVFGSAFSPWIWAYEKGELWRTFIVYPQQMMRELPEVDPQRLFASLRWFSIRYGPLSILALLGGVRLWRDGQRSLLVFILLWGLGCLTLIYAQKQSWWSYHFMLLLVPVGLLAAEGCRALAWQAPNQRHFWRYGLLLLLLLPALIACVMKWQIWASYGFPQAGEELQTYYVGEDPHYREAYEETAFLRSSESLPGPIFVGGEPIYYRAAGRLPATAVHGWSMELYVDPVRQRLTMELQQSTCSYVFLNRSQSDLIAERYPELMVWLAKAFYTKHTSAAGTWYERR